MTQTLFVYTISQGSTGELHIYHDWQVFVSNTRNNKEQAAEIYRKHGEFLKSVIRFNVKNEALRDDIYQEFYLYLTARALPEDIKNIKGFLYKVLTDRIKDAVRDIGRYQGKLARYTQMPKPSRETQPEDELALAEEADKMLDIIEKSLPENEAKAIKMRYRDECDTAETAEILGVKPRSVTRYLSAGLRKARLVINSNGAGI